MVIELSVTRTQRGGGGGGVDSGDGVHDNREINRRNAASKARIFVKIFFNGKEVCQTASKPLLSSDDFVVHIGQIFPIQILQLPETLVLQVRPAPYTVKYFVKVSRSKFSPDV